MSNPSDTTTTLNPPYAEGDSMDESLSVQSDGETEAKRPRVDLGYQGRDRNAQVPLVDPGHPLPVGDVEVRNLLLELILEVRLLRIKLEATIDD